MPKKRNSKTMEIIKETKLKTCCYCGTKLRYDADDIHVAWITNAPYIVCPVCVHKLFDL